MDTKEEEFLKRLRGMFKLEAEEHLNLLSSGLIELEKKPTAEKLQEIIENIFREAHSLKGAARSVERNDIESICQVMESIFSKLKGNKIHLTAEQFDKIHQTIDRLSKMISSNQSETPASLRKIIKQLKLISESDQPLASPISEQKITTEKPTVSSVSEAVAKPETKSILEDESLSDISKKENSQPLMVEERSQLETVRIQIAKLDPLFLQAEQMIQSKIAAIQQVDDLRKLMAFIELWKTELEKRSTSNLAKKEIVAKELIDCNNEKLRELSEGMASIIMRSDNDQRILGRMIDEHLESMKKILMLPISSIIEGFPKLVRDLARSQGKEVEIVIYGKEIEVDKRILEELKDPLIHLIRNCIDHGLEKPEDRLKKGKTRLGTITLKFISSDGRNLEISIFDDGAGINVEKLTASVIKSGLLSNEMGKKLSEQETVNLVFKSGISTSPIITDLSGRGLGLAIVKEKTEKLSGRISVESQPEYGTTFHIYLPLTLSTFRGVLVKTGKQLFMIPTQHVVCVLRTELNLIKTIENRDAISFENEVITLVQLSEVLQLNNNGSGNHAQADQFATASSYVQILILEHGSQKIGFVVDDILDENEILVKKLGKQLVRVQNISGAAVLGSGKIAPVINVPDLMSSAVKEGRMRIKAKKGKHKEKVNKILVTEDSITSRTLIKEILETAGYQVETAVDGLDGYTKAVAGEFDLIVSDVDMPKMNGFELTTKIRNDKKLSELPVVLVTALGSQEDREHGIDVGASAYIVKSSFDQSNLLEIVKKLL